MALSADTYARVLGLDPRHGFLLPSRADGVLGRIDPDQPAASAHLDYPVRKVAWTIYILTLVGLLVTNSWWWIAAFLVAIALMGLSIWRAEKRVKHLLKAYPTPYFKN